MGFAAEAFQIYAIASFPEGLSAVRNCLLRLRLAAEETSTLCRHTFVCVYFLGITVLMARDASRRPSNAVEPAECMLTWVRRNSLPMFSLAFVTAFGRVLSDVHW